jgi:hypothetical protein
VPPRADTSECLSDEALARALAHAREFVRGRGDALARARLDAALGAPRQVLVDALRPLAREGGAFAPASEMTQGDVAGTLAALVFLDEARALGAPEVAGAVAWLASAQRADGAFEPAPGACESGCIAATGVAAGLLARTTCARPAPIRRAGAFLAERWGPARVAGGDFGAIAAYACFFASADHVLSDEGLQWCGRELERGFRVGVLDALQVARVLVLCDARSLPGARLGAEEVVHALAASQAVDGGWRAAAPAALRVAAAVEGAIALVRLGAAGARR